MRMIMKCVSGAVLLAAWMAINAGQAKAQDVCYEGHVQDRGWVPPVCDGIMLGTTGLSKRLEAFMVHQPSTGGDICYQAYGQDYAWTAIKCNGVDIFKDSVGTWGQQKRIEGFVIWHNNPPFGHQLKYRGHISNFGWQGPLDSGYLAGGTGTGQRVEAMEINILRPGEPTPYWQ